MFEQGKFELNEERTAKIIKLKMFSWKDLCRIYVFEKTEKTSHDCMEINLALKIFNHRENFDILKLFHEKILTKEIISHWGS